MEEKSLRSLVIELQKGNQSVFEEIYYQTQQKLYVYALSIMKNENEAKDLLQETYLEIIKSLKNLSDTDKFIPWSKKILFHLAMQRFRKSGTEVLLNEEYDHLIENLEDTDDLSMPEEAYDVNEIKSIVQGIVEELPIVQKLSILAHYYDEMNIKDIAEMMDCSEGTIKTRLHYARLSIKDKLASYEKKHNIRLHALTPLLLLSMKNYDEVYAMPKSSTESIAGSLAKQMKDLPNLVSDDVLISGAKIMGAGVATKTIGGIAITKLIAAIAIVVVAVSSIGIAQTTSSPEKTLENFEKNFNKGDLEGVLDCIDPEAKTLYEGVTGLASAVVDVDVDDLLSSLFGLATGVEYEGRVSIDIVVEDINTNKNEATADVYMILYQGKNLYDSSNEKVTLEKIDGKWYIME